MLEVPRSAFPILADGLQEPAFDHTLRSIEPEHSGSNLADRGQRLDQRAVQLKVFDPCVPPRIEESDRTAGSIYGRNIRSFVPIAEETGVGKIVEGGGTSVLPADDVIDLMRETRTILVHQAVFATALCTFDDEPAGDVVYVMSHWRGSA